MGGRAYKIGVILSVKLAVVPRRVALLTYAPAFFPLAGFFAAVIKRVLRLGAEFRVKSDAV